MPRFACYYTTTASTTVYVEADDIDDATDKADKADLPTICAQCSGWNNPPGIDIGEWEPADEKYGPNIEQVGP